MVCGSAITFASCIALAFRDGGSLYSGIDCSRRGLGDLSLKKAEWYAVVGVTTWGGRGYLYYATYLYWTVGLQQALEGVCYVYTYSGLILQ